MCLGVIIINKILKDFIDYKKQLENDLLNAEDNRIKELIY